MPKEREAFDPELGHLIATRLRKMREHSQYSIADMVRRSGLSRSGILKMEDPERSNPMVSYLAKYLAALDKTLFDFFDCEPWIPSATRDNHAVRTFKRLLDDQKHHDDLLMLLEIYERRFI